MNNYLCIFFTRTNGSFLVSLKIFDKYKAIVPNELMINPEEKIKVTNKLVQPSTAIPYVILFIIKKIIKNKLTKDIIIPK